MSSKKFNDYYKFQACIAEQLGTEGAAQQGKALLLDTINDLIKLIQSGHMPRRARVGDEVWNVNEAIRYFEKAEQALNIPDDIEINEALGELDAVSNNTAVPNTTWTEVALGKTVESKVQDIIEKVGNKEV